jgi:hypothetical protein
VLAPQEEKAARVVRTAVAAAVAAVAVVVVVVAARPGVAKADSCKTERAMRR